MIKDRLFHAASGMTAMLLCCACLNSPSSAAFNPGSHAGQVSSQTAPTIVEISPTPADTAVMEPASPGAAEIPTTELTPDTESLPDLTATPFEFLSSPVPTLTEPPDSSLKIPLNKLYIVYPVTGSKVVSPIHTEAYVMIGDKGDVKIELFGEDGRVMNRQILRYSEMNPGKRFMIIPEINFEIPGVSEISRLQISTLDEYQRTIALTSQSLILLSIGDADVHATNDYLTPFYIQAPTEYQQVQGGVLATSGWIRPLSNQPVMFEIISDQGQVLSSKQILVTSASEGQYTSYELELPYTVTAKTNARLTIHQGGGRISGDIALNSVLVYLFP